jgi:FMN-dependent NADH-azoreductase
VSQLKAVVIDPERQQDVTTFTEPYLRAIFEFIGITDVSFIYADGLAMGDEAKEKSVAAAQAEIQSAIATW